MHKHIITREEYSTNGKVNASTYPLSIYLQKVRVFTALCGFKIEKHKHELWQIYDSQGEPLYDDGPATCETCILLHWVERNANNSFS